MNNKAVFLFVRKPVIGKVKTRLAKDIGDKNAHRYYIRFINETIKKIKTFKKVDKFIIYYSKKSSHYFNKYYGFRIIRQVGDTFNSRLKNSFLDLFKIGYKRVIVLASDSPDVPLSYLKSAITNIDNYDAVIGETEDGGYYLLGLKNPGLLNKIYSVQSSTSKTSQKIKEILFTNNQKVKELGTWYDIDTLSDLKKYLANKTK